MTIEEAFAGALKYESKVRDIYEESAAGTREVEARALYEILGRDEQSHIDYLNHILERWRKTGTLDGRGPETVLPPRDRLEEAMKRAAASLSPAKSGADEGGEQAALTRALAAEEETSAFYRSLVSTLPEEARGIFRRFVEIEDGHTSVVRAQLDLVSRTGYWFDVREFDLED
jgi:rubrerythrin